MLGRSGESRIVCVSLVRLSQAPAAAATQQVDDRQVSAALEQVGLQSLNLRKKFSKKACGAPSPRGGLAAAVLVATLRSWQAKADATEEGCDA